MHGFVCIRAFPSCVCWEDLEATTTSWSESRSRENIRWNQNSGTGFWKINCTREKGRVGWSGGTLERRKACLPIQVDKQKLIELWCLRMNIGKIKLWRKSETDYYKNQDTGYFFGLWLDRASGVSANFIWVPKCWCPGYLLCKHLFRSVFFYSVVDL